MGSQAFAAQLESTAGLVEQASARGMSALQGLKPTGKPVVLAAEFKLQKI
jgi:hypothetical protein